MYQTAWSRLLVIESLTKTVCKGGLRPRVSTHVTERRELLVLAGGTCAHKLGAQAASVRGNRDKAKKVRLHIMGVLLSRELLCQGEVVASRRASSCLRTLVGSSLIAPLLIGLFWIPDRQMQQLRRLPHLFGSIPT